MQSRQRQQFHTEGTCRSDAGCKTPEQMQGANVQPSFLRWQTKSFSYGSRARCMRFAASEDINLKHWASKATVEKKKKMLCKDRMIKEKN